MCGRFALNAKTDEIIKEFAAAGGDFKEWTPRYSIAPTQVVPIVRERADRKTGEYQRRVDAAVWNFHPAFMKDSKRPNFNTRMETVATNGLWKGAFASSRALFPMRGYFEWTGTAGSKQPHYLHSKDGGLLAAAGIYTARMIDDAGKQDMVQLLTVESERSPARSSATTSTGRSTTPVPLTQQTRHSSNRFGRAYPASMTRNRVKDFFGPKDVQSAPVTAARVRATEVFTPSVPAERGFVGRETEMKDLRQKGLNVPGTQVVVWGESGAGKSSLVKKVLEDTGRTAVKTACTPDSTYDAILAAAFSGTGAFYVSETTEHTDVTLSVAGMVGSELIGARIKSEAALDAGKGLTRTPITKPQLTPQRLVRELGARNLSWVIEDFHKVSKATRESIAHALKVFSDEGARYPNTNVIVLGVSESVDELVAPPANVSKRLIDIEVPPLDAQELGKILDAGETLLNVSFSQIRERLLTTSVGIASVTHALALNCCDERDISESGDETVKFTDNDFDGAADGYVRTRSGDLKSRFQRALLVHRKRKFANTLIILRALTQLPEDGGTVGDILEVIRRDEPTYPHSNLTKYLLDLQGEERGALVRKTSANKYRFDEPLQHAFAKASFGLTGPTNDSTKPGFTIKFAVWDEVVKRSSQRLYISMREEIADIERENKADGSEDYEPA